MYPFASLPENLAAFCALLRGKHGFHIGPAELADAARALDVVPLGDEPRVRDALCLVLSGRAEDVEAFDAAFDAFFFPGRGGVRQGGLPPAASLRPEPALAGDARESRRPHPPDADGESPTDGEERGTAAVDGSEGGGEEEAVDRARARWSRSPASGEPPVLARVTDPWREAARALVRRVRLLRSRRWRPAHRGPRFDVRRTWRVSLHTGGEAVTPRWLARPRLRARFVVLIDGSRSMSAYGEAAMRVAVALAGATSRIEVFTFSTTLRRITPGVRAAALAGPQHLRGLHEAWGGGTTIGACLRELVRTAGDRLLGRETCVIVASDGLDAGDPAVLGDAMREIDRRSAAVIWLNPLLGSPGYEPTATGMRIARPHVTTFARVADAADLLLLARLVRLRR